MQRRGENEKTLTNKSPKTGTGIMSSDVTTQLNL